MNEHDANQEDEFNHARNGVDGRRYSSLGREGRRQFTQKLLETI